MAIYQPSMASTALRLSPWQKAQPRPRPRQSTAAVGPSCDRQGLAPFEEKGGPQSHEVSRSGCPRAVERSEGRISDDVAAAAAAAAAAATAAAAAAASSWPSLSSARSPPSSGLGQLSRPFGCGLGSSASFPLSARRGGGIAGARPFRARARVRRASSVVEVGRWSWIADDGFGRSRCR